MFRKKLFSKKDLKQVLMILNTLDKSIEQQLNALSTTPEDKTTPVGVFFQDVQSSIRDLHFRGSNVLEFITKDKK